jgi:hypothetical protein
MHKGLYVSLLPKGKIKRVLVTDQDVLELPEVAIVDEIIGFSELNFGPYAKVVDYLWTIAKAIPSPAAGLTQEEINAYELLLDTTEDLVETLTQEDFLGGTMLRIHLERILPPNFRSPDTADQTKDAIISGTSELMRFQFHLNQLLYDMKDGMPLDMDGQYRIFKHATASLWLTLDDELTSEYFLTSSARYYGLLTLYFLAMKPRVLRCQCCGRYFIPKTKKKTLYCDRISRNGKTCKQRAPALKHKRTAKNQTVIEEFDRAKWRMYKRYDRTLDEKSASEKDLSLLEYYEWLRQATAARDAFLRGELSQEDALRIINVP